MADTTQFTGIKPAVCQGKSEMFGEIPVNFFLQLRIALHVLRPLKRMARFTLRVSTCKHQRRTALPAYIPALSALYPIVPDRTHGVRGTGTAVTKTSLPSQRHTGQIILAGDSRFGTQHLHDRLPLPAMRPDITQSVQHIGQVMRHFMRHRVGNIIRKILSKDIRVVTYLSPGVTYPVHARRPALQIKCHGRRLKFLPQPFFSVLDAATGCSDNLVLLVSGDRFYRHVTFPVRE